MCGALTEDSFLSHVLLILCSLLIENFRNLQILSPVWLESVAHQNKHAVANCRTKRVTFSFCAGLFPLVENVAETESLAKVTLRRGEENQKERTWWAHLSQLRKVE